MQRRLAAAALGCAALASLFTLWTNLAGRASLPPVGQANVAARVDEPQRGDNTRAIVAFGYAKLSEALNHYMRRSAIAQAYAALFSPGYLGRTPETFVKSAALQGADAPSAGGSDEAGAAPARLSASGGRRDRSIRADLTASSRSAALHDAPRASQNLADTRAREPSIFERLFGKPAQVTLAYAAPEDGSLDTGRNLSASRYDGSTAVYDIAAHTVYLPDGTKLEAHSGYGRWLDDPDHTDLRMRGPTPVAVYDLQLREGLFHGVRALRLIPEDETKVFGRSGLLAHTFMLGANGQSNGCVSFRNYDAFLQAYLRGEIKRLAVVARL
jgi:hypothetical protein